MGMSLRRTWSQSYGSCHWTSYTPSPNELDAQVRSTARVAQLAVSHPRQEGEQLLEVVSRRGNELMWSRTTVSHVRRLPISAVLVCRPRPCPRDGAVAAAAEAPPGVAGTALPSFACCACRVGGLRRTSSSPRSGSSLGAARLLPLPTEEAPAAPSAGDTGGGCSGETATSSNPMGESRGKQGKARKKRRGKHLRRAFPCFPLLSPPAPCHTVRAARARRAPPLSDARVRTGCRCATTRSSPRPMGARWTTSR